VTRDVSLYIPPPSDWRSPDPGDWEKKKGGGVRGAYVREQRSVFPLLLIPGEKRGGGVCGVYVREQRSVLLLLLTPHPQVLALIYTNFVSISHSSAVLFWTG